MESPFINDPFAMVYQGFKRLYPDKECEINWEPREITGEDGKKCVGVTTFTKDGSIVVDISVKIPVADAVETLAHELAHVAVGEKEGHNEKWEKAFDAIHEEFDKIGVEMFGEDTAVAVEVSDGKGGYDPERC